MNKLLLFSSVILFFISCKKDNYTCICEPEDALYTSGSSTHVYPNASYDQAEDQCMAEEGFRDNVYWACELE